MAIAGDAMRGSTVPRLIDTWYVAEIASGSRTHAVPDEPLSAATGSGPHESSAPSACNDTSREGCRGRLGVVWVVPIGVEHQVRLVGVEFGSAEQEVAGCVEVAIAGVAQGVFVVAAAFGGVGQRALVVGGGLEDVVLEIHLAGLFGADPEAGPTVDVVVVDVRLAVGQERVAVAGVVEEVVVDGDGLFGVGVG